MGNYSENCEEKIVLNSLEKIKKEKSGGFVTYKLTFGSVSNDSELEGFLKQNFRSGCSLGGKNASTQDGVYNIGVKEDGKDPSISECYLGDWLYEFKYCPAENKAVTWNIGLSFDFHTYDPDIAKTFKFL